MTSDRGRTTTEIRIAGANCPYCFNETLDRLRTQPGVFDARASLVGQCIQVQHAHLPTTALLGLIRRHLHGAELVSSHEPVMVQVDPQVADLHCSHGSG